MPGALLAPPSGAVLAGAPYRLANGGACRGRPRASGTRASRVLGAKGAVRFPKQDALGVIESSRESSKVPRLIQSRQRSGHCRPDPAQNVSALKRQVKSLDIVSWNLRPKD